jgi:hypothetical protein
VHGSDASRRSNCDTADGSSGDILRASGINSLDPVRREIICRVSHTQHVTVFTQIAKIPVLFYLSVFLRCEETAVRTEGSRVGGRRKTAIW